VEEFDSLEHYNRWLRAFALAEGFDIVRHGGGTEAAPAYRFRCFFHGTKTKNTRKLEGRVKGEMRKETLPVDVSVRSPMPGSLAARGKLFTRSRASAREI
jgi:hypothetical protein